MGNREPESQQQITVPTNCKIFSQLPLDSPLDQEKVEEVLKRRKDILSKCPFICTISTYQIIENKDNKTDLACKHNEKMIIFYQPFETKLIDFPNSYRFQQSQIIHFISCIAQALLFMKLQGISYGDICADNICRRNKTWMLIDTAFLKNGITAYEKILEGEPGFVSPKQVEMIRHGFIRESPEITEEDDIFALGLVVLELITSKPSSLCYSASYLRINISTLAEHFLAIEGRVSQKMARLLQRMLDLQQTNRIKLNQLCMQCKQFSQLKIQPKPQNNPHTKNQPQNSLNPHYTKNNIPQHTNVYAFRPPPPQPRNIPYSPYPTSRT